MQGCNSDDIDPSCSKVRGMQRAITTPKQRQGSDGTITGTRERDITPNEREKDNTWAEKKRERIKPSLQR
jgi:hypothetical protein